MVQTNTGATVEPIGQVLQQAGLVSAAQVDVALRDQLRYSDLKLGEIFALRGWLKQQTVNFFAEQWSTWLNESARYPLGFYLQQAALLDENQIQAIVQEQQKLHVRFGVLAVMKGWLKSATRDFFLKSLRPQSHSFAERCLAPTLILNSVGEKVNIDTSLQISSSTSSAIGSTQCQKQTLPTQFRQR